MASVYQFSEEVTGEVSVPSTWFKKKKLAESGCQTDEIQVVQEGTQTIASTLTATDNLEKGVGPDEDETNQRAVMDGVQYAYPGEHFSADKVATFLEASVGTLKGILAGNLKSTAFDRYQPMWAERSNTVYAAYTLTSPHAVEKELHALAVDWNNNGSVIAVGYGRMDSAGWCAGNSYVCVWGISRRDFNENTPHQTLLIDSYVTSLAFHPALSTVLAAGTYSGEVLIWPQAMDDSNEPPLSTQASGVSPKEPVTTLQWVENPVEQRDAHRYLLCAASQDGLVMYWSLSNKLTQPIALFSVQTRRRFTVGVVSLSYTRNRVGGNAANANRGVGGKPCIDNVMLIGLENGEVSRARPGSISSAAPLSPEITRTLDLNNYEGHQGPVHSVATSPFFRNLFLTASSDGSVRLYSVLERAPLLSFEPSIESRHFLYGAEFSPFRPAVIATVSRSSFLHIYDLQQSRTKPCCSLEAGVDGAPVVSIAFNRSSPDWLATGDTRGCVRLWRLSTELVQSTDLERSAIAYSEEKENVAKPASGTKDEDEKGSHPAAPDDESNVLKELFGVSF